MKRFSGFSLMEMMIVLLIVAVVAAASAPMINKKMITDIATDSPWVVHNNSIAYPNKVGIGSAAQVPSNAGKLFITSDSNTAQITLVNSENNNAMGITAKKGSIFLNNYNPSQQTAEQH